MTVMFYELKGQALLMLDYAIMLCSWNRSKLATIGTQVYSHSLLILLPDN